MTSRTLCASLSLCVTPAWPAEQAGSKFPRNRLVRVVTVSQAGLDLSRSDVLEQTMQRLDQAASFRPDIAALPEVFLPNVTETESGRPELSPDLDRLRDWRWVPSRQPQAE